MLCDGCQEPVTPAAHYCGSCGRAVAPPEPRWTGPRWRFRPKPSTQQIAGGVATVVVAAVIGSSSALAVHALRSHHGPTLAAAALPQVQVPQLAWDPGGAASGATSSAAPDPSSPGVATPSAEPGLPAAEVNLIRSADVVVPAESSAAPSSVAASTALRDGLRRTVWIYPREANGVEIVVHFSQPVTLVAVGLDPGNDASDQTWSTDARISLATFAFPDGVQQPVQFTTDPYLEAASHPQVTPLSAPETTTSVTLRIDQVDSSGTFDAVRTAISDIYLLGDRPQT